MPALSREAILARKAGHEQVDLGDGEYVVIRPLKRSELLVVGRMGDAKTVDQVEARDNYIVSCALVEPQLTPDEVGELAESMGAAEYGKISEAIGRLSGLMEDSGKLATKSVSRRRK